MRDCIDAIRYPTWRVRPTQYFSRNWFLRILLVLAQNGGERLVISKGPWHPRHAGGSANVRRMICANDRRPLS